MKQKLTMYFIMFFIIVFVFIVGYSDNSSTKMLKSRVSELEHIVTTYSAEKDVQVNTVEEIHPEKELKEETQVIVEEQIIELMKLMIELEVGDENEPVDTRLKIMNSEDYEKIQFYYEFFRLIEDNDNYVTKEASEFENYLFNQANELSIKVADNVPEPNGVHYNSDMDVYEMIIQTYPYAFAVNDKVFLYLIQIRDFYYEQMKEEERMRVKKLIYECEENMMLWNIETY